MPLEFAFFSIKSKRTIKKENKLKNNLRKILIIICIFLDLFKFFQLVHKNHTGLQTLFASKNRKRFIKLVRLNKHGKTNLKKRNTLLKLCLVYLAKSAHFQFFKSQKIIKSHF